MKALLEFFAHIKNVLRLRGGASESVSDLLGDRPAGQMTNAVAGPVSSFVWTPAQVELRDWLRRIAPPLADAYEGAIALLYGTRVPGRLRFVGHAVRDLANGLPEVVSGVKARRLDYVTTIDQVIIEWRRSGLQLVDFAANGAQDLDAPREHSSDVVIPRRAFVAIQELLKEHSESRSRPRETALRLFNVLLPDDPAQQLALRPVLDQWLDVTNWFVRRAHFPRGERSSEDVHELRRKFELFETTLMTLVRPFFTTTEALDAILEDANS